MSTKILRKLPLKFQKYNISKIESGASKKIFYRLSNNNKTFIVINFSPYKQEYDNYVNSPHCRASKTINPIFYQICDVNA